MTSKQLLSRLSLILADRPIPRDTHCLCSTIQRSPFSSSSPAARAMATQVFKKPNPTAMAPKKGRKTLKISKTKPPPDPTVGTPEERKAFRTRVVLSNTNANDVSTLQDLDADNIRSESSVGKVFKIPGAVVDSLRTLGAFKRGQRWNNYKHPSFLMTREAWDIAQLMDSTSSSAELVQTVRKVIAGERRSGKSVLILQILSIALTKGWVVLNIPESCDLTDSVSTDYAPIKGRDPPTYAQSIYTSQLLAKLAQVNGPILGGMKTIADHDLPVKVEDSPTLLQLAEIGARDSEHAWPMFEALWKELNTKNSPENEQFGARPPVLFCADNISYLFCNTQYQILADDQSLKPVHAFDLALPKMFVDLLTGHQTLTNGGAVLGAMSSTQSLKCPPLDVGINLAEARSTADGAALSLSQFWNPLAKIDRRVMDHVVDLDVVRLTGLPKQQARELIEYWALSGLVRERVRDSYVGQKWALSGGGIIGELERAVVQSLTAGA